MAECVASSIGIPNTYLYALAKHTHTNLLATIASDDSIRFLDADSLKTLQIIGGAHRGIACLGAGHASHFITAGRDGMVRCWDSRMKQAIQMADPRANGISALACHHHYIAAGTESLKEGLGDVSVLLFDIRKPNAPLRSYVESHTDTITQLKFHPSHPQVVLSGSTDGLISVFDINQEDEDDALQQVLNPRSAVHCAGFLAPDKAYVVSTDEQFSIYPLAKTAADEELLPPPIHFGDVREKLQCMYVIDVLVQVAGPPLIAYGHNENQTLSISSLGAPSARAFGQTIQLPRAHGDDVVRDLFIMEQRAFSCGEDGLVKAWALR